MDLIINGKKASLIKSDAELEPLRDNPPIVNQGGVQSDYGGLLDALYQLLPDYRKDSADVDLGTRTLTKNTARSSEEEAKILQKLGHPGATSEGGVTRIDGKVFDDPTMLSISETLKEIPDNLDTLLTLPAKNPYTIAGAEGGVSALKEAGRSALLGEEYDITNPISDTATALVADDLTKGLPGARGIAGKGLKKIGLGDRVKDTASGFIDSAKKSSLSKKALAKTENAFQNFISRFSGDEALAKELGAPSPMLRMFKNTPVTENLKYLRENSPEFVENIMNPTSFKNRAVGAIDLHNKIGNEIGEFYQKSDIQIPVRDIIGSESSLAMASALENKNIPLEVRDKLLESYSKYVLDIADRVLPGNEAKELIDAGVSAGDLLEYIADMEIPISDAFNMRVRRDSLANWGKKNVDVFDEVNQAVRGSANSFREAIKKSLVENLGEDAEILKKAEIFHNLVPITRMIDNRAAELAGVVPSIGTMLPGVINTPPRYAAALVQKLSKNTGLKGLARSTKDKILDLKEKAPNLAMPEVLTGPGMQAAGEALGGTRRGMAQLSGSEISENITADTPQLSIYEDIPNFQPEAAPVPTQEPQDIFSALGLSPEQAIAEDFNPDELLALAPGVEAPKLPRSPELISGNPQLLEPLLQQLHPDTVRLFNDAVESKDKLKIRTAMNLVMQEAPEAFEPSVTGNRSEMMVGDHFVITDPQEAELYRQSILSKFDLGEVGSVFVAKQLSHLNNPRDMRVLPMPGQQVKKPELSNEPKPSPLRAVQDKAKRISTVAGERRSYDY